MHDNSPIVFDINFGQPRKIKLLTTSRVQANSNLPFNIADHIGDDPALVINSRIMLNKLLPSTPLYINQTHSNVSITSNSHNIGIEADAIWTSEVNIPIVVMTADCVPITITNNLGEFVAVIHAGWKGLLNGVIQNTISQLKFDKDNFIVFIGPHICDKCFEVSDDVYEKFATYDQNFIQYFKSSKDKYLANLSGIATYILQNKGITNIIDKNICTICQNKWFYSYRIDKNLGRIATVAWIEL